jgi:hypothetical protein
MKVIRIRPQKYKHYFEWPLQTSGYFLLNMHLARIDNSHFQFTQK